MTANLLARTDLFAAGIARSGAYNRTLTPFGFQSEERSLWNAGETYEAISPFNHADKIKAPLLLIHGDADPNPGTFPMQSERMFAAIKGLGGTARLCLLPNEGHWYRARESIMHMLAEQHEWLEAHCRGAAPRAAPPEPKGEPDVKPDATPGAPPPPRSKL
jgi:dipeptidyl aminopeptidase/acylaminoacyl peptidase